MQFPTDQLTAFAKQYSIPSYVKTATTRVFEDITDPRTKVACYLANFAALTGDLTVSKQELQKRASILNISDDIDQLARNYADFKLRSMEKTAAPTEKYPIRSG